MAHPSAPTQFIWSWRRFFISVGIIGLIVFTLFLYALYMGTTNPQGRYRVIGERAYAIEATILSADDIAQSLEVSGTVQPARQVDLRPLTAGQITYVNPNLTDGSRVSEGEILIEIDPASAALALRQAENALKEAEASAERAITGDIIQIRNQG